VYLDKCVDDGPTNIKQGGFFSPQSWTWLKNDSIKQLLNSGTFYEKTHLRALILYADDTANDNRRTEQAQRELDIVRIFCKKGEIKINERKTVWMKLELRLSKERSRPIYDRTR